ncbi:MAG TPA: ABC transporter permease [Candidatus Dormibacteraeota bacterium]|nr:ABC transporter permease [Candidatus Dormibacteraeota bacterium]
MATASAAAGGRPGPRLQSALRNAAGAFAVPIGSVIFAFVVGGLIVAATGVNPLTAYQGLLCGGIGVACANGENPALELSTTIVYFTPLILAGVAVALPFRAGLFNIGGEGQFLMGAVACTVIGVKFGSLPAPILLPLVMLGGMAAGAAWAGIAGVLKATVGAHEVVTTIMLNYIAQWFVRYLIVGGPLQLPHGFSVSSPIGAGARLPTFFPNDNHLIIFGLPAGVYRVHSGLVIAIAALAVFAILLWRTSLGYEIRAVGQSQRAARYGGIDVPRTIIVTMLIAGAFAGLAGAIQIAGVDHNLTDKYFNDTTGFDAIAVALLGLGSAIGIFLASVLFGALYSGGAVMQADAGISSSLVQILQALILFSIAANFLRVLRLRFPVFGQRPSAPAPDTPGAALMTEAAKAPPPVDEEAIK